MSYRFGLSPSDVVLDARGNVLNTTLTLYVLEADADARTNPLVAVPVSSGNWTYTHATYKSLWARTETSDTFPVVSIDAQIAALANTVSVTDNGDGGFTLSGAKLGGWQWAKDTFVAIANAVSLAITDPAPPGTAFAGTADTAARGDHVHAMPPAKPAVVGLQPSGATGVLSVPSTNGGTSLNRANYSPFYISTPGRKDLPVSALGLDVTSAASAGGTIRYAIYGAGADGLCDFTNKFFETGEISSTTTGRKMTAHSRTLHDGDLLWIGVVMHTATCQLQNTNTGIAIQNPSNEEQTFGAMYKDGVTGSLPTSGINVNGDMTPNLYYTAA